MLNLEDDVLDHNALLAQAGLDLMSCESDDDVFVIVSRFLTQLMPGVVVIISQATSSEDALITRDVLGLDQPLLARASELMGFEPRGRRSVVDAGFRERYAERRLVHVVGGIAELAASEIPRPVADILARVFGIRDVYTIGIADSHRMFGVLHFFTRAVAHTPPERIIESFVYQCFLTIRSLRAQQALRESEEKYRLLTERISDVVWTLDPETLRFLYVSPSVERLRGFTPAEIIAEPMDAALTPEGSAYVRRMMAEKLALVESGEESYDAFHVEELEQPCKDGSTVWTEVVTSYYFNERTGRYEVRGVTRDITERRRSEESLRVYAGLLEASPASVIVFNESGEFLYANEKTLELHGYTRDEFMALNLSDLDVPEDAEHVHDRFLHTVEYGENSFEVVHFCKDGSLLPFSVRNRAAVWDGRPVVLSVGTDITEHKRHEQQLIEGTERLEAMVHDVAEAMGRIVEVRDPYTQGHEVRVAALATLIAQDMGLTADETAGVEMAALVHDIGKLCVPAEILNKAGVLLSIEFELIKQHPQAGYDILKDIAFPWNVAEAVLQHHERMDGSGYPNALRGDEISVTARILAAADVVEAMASHRPYRPALSVEAAMEEICGHPEQYDAEVVASCVRLHAAGLIVW